MIFENRIKRELLLIILSVNLLPLKVKPMEHSSSLVQSSNTINENYITEIYKNFFRLYLTNQRPQLCAMLKQIDITILNNLICFAFMHQNMEFKKFLTEQKTIIHNQTVNIIDDRIINNNLKKTHNYLTKNCPKAFLAFSSKLPLHKICALSNVEIIKRELEKPNVDLNDKDENGYNCLHCACLSGSYEVSKLLLDRGVDPNKQANDGITPLHLACRINKPSLVELLLKYGADPLVKVKNGNKAIDLIFLNNNNFWLLKILNYLSKNHSVQYQDLIKHALKFACERNDHNLFQELLKFKPDLNLRYDNEATLLHLACMYDNKEAIKALLGRKININEVAKDNITALHLASHQGNHQIVKYLLESQPKKIKIDQYNIYQLTPLHSAIMLGHVEVVKELISHGADIEKLARFNLSPLHLAAIKGNEELMHFLIIKGVNLNSQEEFGRTPLMVAIEFNQTIIARILLEHGADINIQDNNGITATDLAFSKPNRELIDLFRQFNHEILNDDKAKEVIINIKTEVEKNNSQYIAIEDEKLELINPEEQELSQDSEIDDLTKSYHNYKNLDISQETLDAPTLNPKRLRHIENTHNLRTNKIKKREKLVTRDIQDSSHSNTDQRFNLIISKKMLKNFMYIDPKLERAISETIKSLRTWPFCEKLDIKKLSGNNGLHRLRVGKYRIIFRIDIKQSAIFIIDVSLRSSKTYDRYKIENLVKNFTK